MANLSPTEIESIVLNCIAQFNEMRDPESRLAVAGDAKIFGEGSPLDSMGLVTLTMDLEDAFAEHEAPVSLSNAQAMSQRRSPYRDVPALVGFIHERLSESNE